MKSFFNHSIKIVLLLMFAIAASSTINAQEPSKLRLDRLNQLEDKADEVIEVNIDGKLLDIAKGVLRKLNNKDTKKVAEAIAGLKGIYVKICNFSEENQYSPSDFDAIRSQISTPNWQRMVGVRSKKQKQNIEVFTMFEGQNISGVAVIISDAKTLGVVNVVGPIDIDLIVELSGHLSIPKIEIEKDNDKDKDKDKDESKVVIKAEIKNKTKKP